MAQTPASTYRKVLLMVGSLHQAGYERLRIFPSMSPSGAYWRCSIGPASVADRASGARVAFDFEDAELLAHYSSGEEDSYFGIDGSNMSPEELGQAFIDRFPRIAVAASGRDEPYVMWFKEMLRLTDPNHLPYAFADWETPDDALECISPESGEQLVVPLPPSPPSD